MSKTLEGKIIGIDTMKDVVQIKVDKAAGLTTAKKVKVVIEDKQEEDSNE